MRAAAAAPAEAAGNGTAAQQEAWKKFVLAPSTAFPRPLRVEVTSGSVTNAAALVNGHAGEATFTTTVGSSATIVLDFGVNISGTPEFQVSNMTGAGLVSLGYSETRKFVLDATGAPASDGNLVVPTGVPDPLVVVPSSTQMGKLRAGFRFLAVQLSSPGTMSISALGVRWAASYRATPDKFQGSFLSSSDQLNRIWYAGAYTDHLDMVPAGSPPAREELIPSLKPTEQDAIYDGAKRDRLVWSGDVYVQGRVIWTSLGTNGQSYYKQSLVTLLKGQTSDGQLRGNQGNTYSATYSAYTAIDVIDYYRRTGDRAFLVAALPQLERAEQYHQSLLDENSLIVSDDSDYWLTRQDGEVTEYSLVYVEFLDELTWAERSIGRGREAKAYASRAQEVRKAIDAHLWDDKVGAYVHSDQDRTHYPLDANANAIRSGLATGDRAQRILRFLRGGWTPHGAEL